MESQYTRILPPTLATRFLKWSLPSDIKEPVLGDLEEEFITHMQCELKSKRANSWYWKQSIRTGVQFMFKTNRGFFMFLLSILVFIATTSMGMYFAGEIWFFWDVPSLLLVMPAFFFAMAATSYNDFMNAFAVLSKDAQACTLTELNVSKVVFQVLGNSAVILGIFTTMIGWVAMGSNIEPEAFSKVIGPAFGVSILTIMYGLVIKVLSYVAEKKLAYKALLIE